MQSCSCVDVGMVAKAEKELLQIQGQLNEAVGEINEALEELRYEVADLREAEEAEAPVELED